MAEDVYTRLREFLDNMPYGYPTTDSGVELKILKKLFTPERAEIKMKLTPMPETAAQIAPRLGMDEAQAAETLESMAQDGLILRLRAGDVAMYGATSYMVGIYEFQIKTIDRELSELMEEFLPHIYDVWNSKTKALRVVPLGAALEGDKQVATYNQVEEIIKGKQLIAVAPCICTKEQEQLGNKCSRPQERCILFDAFAQYYMDNGMARQIDEKELADLLKMGEEKGLVLSPGNSKDIMNICLCCDCCCAILGMLQKSERAADQIQSSYQAKIDPDLCVLCGTCEERCQVQAIKEGDDSYEVDTAQCIGCGVCVPTCPDEAISLVDKPETATVPENIFEMQGRLAQERGVG